jgi:hypothetical protein
MINEKPYKKKHYKVTTTDYKSTGLRICELAVVYDERTEIPDDVTDNDRCRVQLNYFRTRVAALEFRDRMLRRTREVLAW